MFDLVIASISSHNNDYLLNINDSFGGWGQEKMQPLACVVEGLQINPVNREEEISINLLLQKNHCAIHFSELKHTVTAKCPYVVRIGLCKKINP